MNGWLVADRVWWGPGTLAGPAGIPLRDGVPTGARPVPESDIPAGEPRHRVGGTVLPGLLDAHVHTGLIDPAALWAGGVSAVWDLGGVPENVARWRDEAARPGARLPRVTMAGPFLTAPGGYPSDRPWAAPGSWRAVGSAHDAAAAVGECRAAGAALVKAVLHTGAPSLPGRTLRALVVAAHAAGLPVVVHAEGAGTVTAAVATGADVLAHTPWTERLDEPLLRACAASMTWISTLDIHGWGDPGPEQAVALDNLRRFLAHGGRVRYGTDLGNGPLPVGVNAREVRLLQAVGLDPERVLAAMTRPAAAVPPCRVPGGLHLDPDRFADDLATARVVRVTP